MSTDLCAKAFHQTGHCPALPICKKGGGWFTPSSCIPGPGYVDARARGHHAARKAVELQEGCIAKVLDWVV